MIDKYPLPFTLSAATLLVACLIATNHPAYAAKAEDPAVLDFATTYAQQEKTVVPPPSSVPPPPAREEVTVKSRPPQVVKQATPQPNPRPTALQKVIKRQQQKISKKNNEISQLEKQIAALKQSVANAQRQSAAIDETPHLNQADKQALLDMAGDLRNLFSFKPTQSALMDTLAQVKKQLHEAQLAQVTLRNQLKTAIDGKNNAEKASEAAFRQQVEKYQQQIARLEQQLAASSKNINGVTAEKSALQAQLQALTAKNASEQQKLADENRLLLSKGDVQQAAIKKQIQQLTEKLNDAQQSKAVLGMDKAKLQAQLEARPTPEKLAESQLTIKSLQSKMDQLQAEKTELAASQAAAEKENARAREQQISALQAKLDDALTRLAKNNTANTSETVIKQQSEQHHQQIARLEQQLAASSKNVETVTLEKDRIQSQLQALTAKSASEQQKFADEKQQLLNKIAGDRPNDALLAASKKQIQELTDKLNDTQQMKTMLESDKAKLQSQLTARPTPEQLAESQLIVKSLQSKLDQLHAAKTAPAETPGVADNAKESARNEQISALQAKLDDALARLATSEKQAKAPESTGSLPLLTADELKKQDVREAYAIGMSLGGEILQMQAQNGNWGTSNDRSIVLAGIVDAFKDQAKLSTKVLTKTLTDVSQRVEKHQKTLLTDLDKSTKDYLQRFTRLKETKKSPVGFWYNVNHPGDTPLPKNATLDVIVKESLTNGDVITDMNANGTVLTLPLAEYPPVFREALSKLKNHGSVTIVVPPALAYKEKGMPPKIPPNATMVYNLKIAESYPEPKKIK